eukprot:scaffold59572_cov34-Phaeocystis_antarctica.AAC.1
MRVNACMLTPPSQRASIFHRVHQSKRERMLPASLVLAEEPVRASSRAVLRLRVQGCAEPAVHHIQKAWGVRAVQKA